MTNFSEFQKRVEKELMTHPVILNNEYTRWFAKGDLNLEDVRQMAIQFSVFSNLFTVAQLQKTLNAETLDEMRRSKEILMNELGVIFHRKTQESAQSLEKRAKNAESEGDPQYVNTEGSIEGGNFRFRAAHFEWFLAFAEPLGLKFSDIGKRKHGWPSTLVFTDGLEHIYANEDFNVGSGASYGIENWAAAGFWKELISGLQKFKEKEKINLPISFFNWHDKVEDQHAAHTQEELAEIFHYPNFDGDVFIASGQKMLDACKVFWDGLNQERLQRRHLN